VWLEIISINSIYININTYDEHKSIIIHEEEAEEKVENKIKFN
jgi:hypothetical protein